MQPNIGYDQTTPLVCESCGHDLFTQVLHIRKASALLTGTGQPGYIPIPVFACQSCNHVNAEFLPKETPNLRIVE